MLLLVKPNFLFQDTYETIFQTYGIILTGCGEFISSAEYRGHSSLGNMNGINKGFYYAFQCI